MSVDYKNLFESLPESFILFAPDFSILDASEGYLRDTKRKREDLVGKNVFKAFPDNPDDAKATSADKVKASVEHAFRHKQMHVMDTMRYDIPLSEEEGGGFETRYWDAYTMPVVDAQGEVSCVLHKVTDVTDRIIAEESSRLARKALLASEERFSFLADAIPELVRTADEDNNTIFLNQKWLSYTELPIEELINGAWLEAVHPEDRAGLNTLSRQALARQQDYQMDMRIRKHDGEYRWHLMRSMARKDAAGKLTNWVASFTDIHDQKKLIEELLLFNEQLSDLSDKLQLAYQRAERDRKTLEDLLLQAPAAICVLKGPEHIFELINPNYQKLFPSRDLQGRPVRDALPEVVEQGFVTLLDSVYHSGNTYLGEEMLIQLDRDGTGLLTPNYFNFTYQPLYEGDKITGIVVFAYDVTDLVEARQRVSGLSDSGKVSGSVN